MIENDSTPSVKRFASFWRRAAYVVNSGDEKVVNPETREAERVVTLLDWRSTAFTEHCIFLDRMYLHQRVQATPGNTGPGGFPEYRRRGSKRKQQILGHAPVGLPENCYDAKWLRSLSVHQREALHMTAPMDFTLTEEETKSAPTILTHHQ